MIVKHFYDELVGENGEYKQYHCPVKYLEYDMYQLSIFDVPYNLINDFLIIDGRQDVVYKLHLKSKKVMQGFDFNVTAHTSCKSNFPIYTLQDVNLHSIRATFRLKDVSNFISIIKI